MYIPFQVNRFQRIILLIVQYKYLKSWCEDFVLRNVKKSDPSHKSMRQSVMYVNLKEMHLEKVFYLSFSTNIENHLPEIFILQNLILHTRSFVFGFITQSGWVFNLRVEFFIEN